MNSLVRGLPTESIEAIWTLQMPCKPHSQNKNVLTTFMTSSIRHQFFEFSPGDRPDFPLSNFKKKIILVLSLLSSFRSGLCTKYSKILTRPTIRIFSLNSTIFPKRGHWLGDIQTVCYLYYGLYYDLRKPGHS